MIPQTTPAPTKALTADISVRSLRHRRRMQAGSEALLAAIQRAQAESKVPAPPYIDPADMPEVYALTGRGICMEPLFADGALLVGDKRESPQPGDTVLVYFRRDAISRYGMPGWVKQLVHIWPLDGEDPLITLEQLNPRRRYIVPASHIAAMHKCVGTATSTGKGTAAYRPLKREVQP